MDDKTSDESDDEFECKTSDASGKGVLVKDSSNDLDSSCDESESDIEERELPDLRKSSEHRPLGIMHPNMKSSLYAKLNMHMYNIPIFSIE